MDWKRLELLQAVLVGLQRHFVPHYCELLGPLCWPSSIMATRFGILYIGISFYSKVCKISSLHQMKELFKTSNFSGEAVVCTHLVSGYLYYGPALVIGIFYSLAVSIGFLFLIIPGLYLWVALAFSLGVYLEYQQNGIRILEAMQLSAGVVNKRFCSVACFLIINALFSFSGVLLFGIGIFITTPVSLIAIAYAFEDIFGMNRERHPDTSCVCC